VAVWKRSFEEKKEEGDDEEWLKKILVGLM
jgi:hypothetical protein